MKKEFWTTERRKAKSERMKYSPPCGSYLAGKVRCAKCGETFRRETRHYKDGTIAKKWLCQGRKNGCDADAIDEEILKSIYMEIFGCEEFSEDRMSADVDYITVVSNREMIFHLANGRDIRHGWQKLVRPRPKHSKEYKVYMSEYMKKRWASKKEESHQCQKQ